MEEQSPIAVLICGAGAAGLTLAIDLARRGVPFRLIEKRARPFPGSRGKGIQPRTQEVFEDLGIIDRLVAAGGVYPPSREYRDDGGHAESDMVEPQEPTPAEPYHLALMVPQFLTERVMRERLAEFGHHVEFGCELVGFEQDASGVTARLVGPEGEQTVRARYLVGADGGRSFVRGALGVDFPGKTLGVRAMVADVLLTGLDRDAWHQFNRGDMERQVSVCPLAGTDLFQLQAPIPLEGEVDLSAEGLERMVASRTGRSGIRVQSVSWASAYTMNARLAERYRVGRVFLVGDAAHIHPPTGGQGLNTSVQDAYNLGWKLAAVLGGAAERLLDSYEEERRPVAEAVLGLSTRLLDAMKRGVNRRTRDVRQLDIGYPESSLALGSSARPGGLLAGARAPDAPLRGAAGCSRRLFELFAGPHWTLVGFETKPDIVAPRRGLRIHEVGVGRELSDEAGHLREAYGLAPGEWVLVRPDGYVGAIVASEEAPTLDSYLAGVGLAVEGAEVRTA
ncbi:putative flavodoxin monooxygenase [Cystobacter fuscus DSM 2262]|uniref:Flavodoxin monooxygenase n=1 Tax=Cystobacter fuscus (strain ATCC 25194 / DSM 2262 / NBRC 100088 / M29) TaxID=1242864 RepID=S9P917_CYSF2|nr:FAD-dependent oxidoreductase [Cystobacter fuscus]EPX58762.1 putative flavodoxin monooxygenase [Cystobacter fuscus DSM 2262]